MRPTGRDPEPHVIRYISYLNGKDDDLPGWLDALDAESKRDGRGDAVESFIREWVRIKRLYA